MSKEAKKEKEETVPKFRYEAIINSAWYKRVDRDLLTILLDKDKVYTREEVQNILDEEKKRKVK